MAVDLKLDRSQTFIDLNSEMHFLIFCSDTDPQKMSQIKKTMAFAPFPMSLFDAASIHKNGTNSKTFFVNLQISNVPSTMTGLWMWSCTHCWDSKCAHHGRPQGGQWQRKLSACLGHFCLQPNSVTIVYPQLG